jgi:hypothetical protein
MAPYPDEARRYRERAQELRTKADQFSPENRDMLLKMADYYDHFALQLEQGLWDAQHLRPGASTRGQTRRDLRVDIDHGKAQGDLSPVDERGTGGRPV